MSKAWVILWIGSIVWGTGCRAPMAGPNVESLPLPNGVYSVLERAPSRETLSSPEEGQRVIVLPGEWNGDAPEYLLIRNNPVTLLELASEPRAVPDEKYGTILHLTLSPESGKELEDFTRRHIMGQVAVVIGGDAATVHKIRTPVGRHLQISCCNDGGGDYLLSRLQGAW